MLKVGVRPKAAARARNSAMRSAVGASGSPNMANTSQCFDPMASAPSDEPPKNKSGCGFWNGWMSDLAPRTL